MEQRGRSNACVSAATHRPTEPIEQQGSNTNSRVRVAAITVVEDQRSSANASIEARAADAEERTPTKPRIRNAGGFQVQCLLSFCRVEPGVSPVGGRNDCSRLRRKRKAHQNERDEKEPAP